MNKAPDTTCLDLPCLTDKSEKSKATDPIRQRREGERFRTCSASVASFRNMGIVVSWLFTGILWGSNEECM